jgi:type I restriction enzyme, S subunit
MGGSTPSRAEPKYFGGGIPWVKTTDLNNGPVCSTEETLTDLGLKESSCKMVPAHSVLVAMYGGFNQIGRTGLLQQASAINQALTAIIPDRAKLTPEFLLEWLNFRVTYWKRLAGSSRKDPNITKGDVADFPVPAMPVDHQIGAARVLQIWNTAIQKIEQLLEANGLAYKALRRQLVREHSFPRRRLSEIARRVTRKNMAGDGHPLTISSADGLVSQSRYFGKRIAAAQTEHYTLLKRGEFAYNRSYSAGYPFGAIKRLDGHEEGIVSTLYLCFALSGDDAPISDYFVHFCESGGFNHQIYQVAQEGARNHGLLNVTADDFFAMSMPVPPRGVQERVVRGLDAAHRELTLLREQLAALRAQKRGLMQKLLTGEWRLRSSEQEAI